MKASKSLSLSSYLKCNPAPRHGGAGDERPQPQTATCCTALQRGFDAEGGLTTQLRYAPLRTPGSAALLQHDDPIEEEEEEEEHQQQQQQTPTKKKMTATKTMIKKMVRKCKSSVADVDVSKLSEETPRLRRSGAVRRDWSFEDLPASHKAA